MSRLMMVLLVVPACACSSAAPTPEAGSSVAPAPARPQPTAAPAKASAPAPDPAPKKTPRGLLGLPALVTLKEEVGLNRKQLKACREIYAGYKEKAKAAQTAARR